MNVSEYPGKAGKIRPILNSFDIKRLNHDQRLVQVIDCMCCNTYINQQNQSL